MNAVDAPHRIAMVPPIARAMFAVIVNDAANDEGIELPRWNV
jgi:hypothetical protein